MTTLTRQEIDAIVIPDEVAILGHDATSFFRYMAMQKIKGVPFSPTKEDAAMLFVSLETLKQWADQFSPLLEGIKFKSPDKKKRPTDQLSSLSYKWF